jgi:hypothetical protein
MKENTIVEKIRGYLKSVPGLFFWKEHGGMYGTQGLPDIVCCYRGRFIAFECKTETGKTTVLQEITLRRIRSAGGTAEVVRCAGEVKTVIERIAESEV